MENQVSMQILPGEDFLGITLSDRQSSISIEIDDMEQLEVIKQAITLVMKNMKSAG